MVNLLKKNRTLLMKLSMLLNTYMTYMLRLDTTAKLLKLDMVNRQRLATVSRLRLDTAKLLKLDMFNRQRLATVSRLRLDTDSNSKPRLVTAKLLRLVTHNRLKLVTDSKRKLDMVNRLKLDMDNNKYRLGMARRLRKLLKPPDMASQHLNLYKININR